MMKCKQAMEGTSCGKTCCCLECEEKDHCPDVCSSVADQTVKQPSDCKDAFTEESGLAVMQNEAAAIIKACANLTLQKKQIEDQEKQMRKQLQEAMEKYGVKSFETPEVKFVYVAPTTRNTIDSKALKAELPDVAARFTKTSNVSASVKITVK